MDGPLKIIKFGNKQIFLPKFTVALIRTPRLSPYHAKFQVPLNFSKFDLRDYLFHAYNVRALSIRSSIHHQAIRDSSDARRQWFRPEAKKFMTIEMDKPFVWPKQPESWGPWGKKERKTQQAEALESLSGSTEGKKQAARSLRDQARDLLRGKESALEKWERERTGKLIKADEKQYKIRV